MLVWLLFLHFLLPAEIIASDTGWISKNGKKYKVVDRKVEFIKALSECAAMGAKLAEPRNKQQNDALESLNIKDPIWLGFSDRATEGKYVWESDQSPVKWFKWAVWYKDNTDNNTEGDIVLRSGSPSQGVRDFSDCVTMVNDWKMFYFHPDSKHVRGSWHYENCKDTSRYNYVCEKTGKSYGSECITAHECDVGFTCHEGNCGCQNLAIYYYDTRNKKCASRKSYGSECITAQECDVGLTCHDGKCGCQNLANNYYDTRNKKCTFRKDFWWDCLTAQECVDGLTCYDGKCRYRRPYGDECVTAQECDVGLTCHDGKCGCQNLANYYYDTRTRKCESRKALGSDCLTAQECVDPWTCYDGKCGCSNVETYDTFTKKCIESNDPDGNDFPKGLDPDGPDFPKGLDPDGPDDSAFSPAAAAGSAERPRHVSLVELLFGAILTCAVGHAASGNGQ